MKCIFRKIFQLLTLLIFLSSMLHSNAQTTDSSAIITDRKLMWENFKGEVDKNSLFGAMTYWFVKWNYQANLNSSDTVKCLYMLIHIFKVNRG